MVDRKVATLAEAIHNIKIVYTNKGITIKILFVDN